MNNDLSSLPNPNIQLSRTQLLNWINSYTKLGLTKIQQLGSGVAYCQIIEILHPRFIPSAKMYFKAKSEYEFINNYKLLQQSFLKLGVYKNIDIEKLVKCKYQDNLQFLQWFHKFFQNQLTRRDPLDNSQRNSSHNRSIPKRAPSFNNSSHISKIRGKSQAPSFQNVLDDLAKPTNTNGQKQLCQFYKSKIFEIQQLAQLWDPTDLSGNLKDKIKQILQRTPTQVVLEQINNNVEL